MGLLRRSQGIDGVDLLRLVVDAQVEVVDRQAEAGVGVLGLRPDRDLEPYEAHLNGLLEADVLGRVTVRSGRPRERDERKRSREPDGSRASATGCSASHPKATRRRDYTTDPRRWISREDRRDLRPVARRKRQVE